MFTKIARGFLGRRQFIRGRLRTITRCAIDLAPNMSNDKSITDL